MKNLTALNKYFLRYKWKLSLGILFILLSDIAQISIPYFIKGAVDDFSKNISISSILNYSLLIVGASFVSGVFRFLIRETIIVVSREIEFDLRSNFWRHIQKLSYRFFQDNSTGNIMAHATNDIAAVRMYVGPATMYFIDIAIKLVIIITILFSINVELTLYSLAPFPLIAVLVYIASKKIFEKYVRIQESFASITSKAQESFSGIRIIKSYVREKREIFDFKKLSENYFTAMIEKIKIQSLFVPIIVFITGLSLIFIIWKGGTMVINNELTLGEIAAFTAYIGFLTWPVIAFGWIVNIIQQASAGIKRISNLLEEKIEIKDAEEADQKITELKGEIKFENVNFGYKETQDKVLKNISFEVAIGKTIAIIGRTGTGKTSLVNLIPRLYNATSGKISIDNIPIEKIPLKTLRKNIAMVPQEAFLFSDTIRNNILYGSQNGEEELLSIVTEIACFTTEIESFPQKYETMIGEKGVTLSGGQRQRTSLARALASNPKILIMDDSFSAVDTKTEETVLQNLKSFMKGRTSIIISHRISTIKDADKIIVLEKGEIAEEGTHQELLDRKGIYAEIYKKQLFEEEIEELG